MLNSAKAECIQFDRVIVIGSGKIVCDCAKILCKLMDKEKIFIIESGNNSISIVASWSQREGIDYFANPDSGKIEQRLKWLSQDYYTLIISVNNFYLFPTDIVEKVNIKIINFHYSLLPKYRGINIPTWVIYNGENQTGITWHYVDERIDHGMIIDQKIIPIYEETTALEIVRQGMKLGVDSFGTFISQLLCGNVTGQRVNQFEERIYKKKELPNNGYLKIEEDIIQITRILRAYDYGKMEMIPRLKMEWDNTVYSINKYMISKDINLKERSVFCEGTKCVIEGCSYKIELQICEEN